MFTAALAARRALAMVAGPANPRVLYVLFCDH